VGRTISLRQSLADDPDPLRAPPDWRNTELGTVNGSVVLHAGTGQLEGSWHSQDSDECLLVLEGELVVELEDGPQRAGPGEAILISAGERHRTAVPKSCTLLSVEGVAMNRVDG
jgi:quercetin dioxygenase-like cupin family protein